MSQSNDSLAPCKDNEEHGEAAISLCDALRSGARGRKKRTLATVTIVDLSARKRKRNSCVWKMIQQFAPPTGKYSMRCSVEFSVFLDPRRKMVSEKDCIGGGNVLHTMAILDIEEPGHRFVGNATQRSNRALAPVPAPAPVLAPTSAPGLATPAATLPRVSSVMEQDA